MTEQRAGIGRITAAIVAVAAMLPYLTLKILWLTGSSVGVTDPALMNDPATVALNAMTFGMEAVALALALAFTTRKGLRLPAWLVLPPLWVGTGLLSVVVVTAPVVVAVAGLEVFGGTAVEPWVYMMVYGGFMGQGIGLMAAFVLYSRDRWPAVFTTPAGLDFPSPTRSFQTVVAWGALLVATAVGGVRLSRVFGAETVTGVMEGVKGLLAIAGAVALAALVRRWGRGPFWRPLVVAWLGSGSLFGWGLYAMIVTLVGGPLTWGGGADLVELFGVLTGLVMGMCGAFLLVERSGVRDVQPVQEPLEGDDRDRDRRAAYHGHR
ncbi:hypothetical protein SAMN05444920_10325 [Nonomuraea solani]|uniref:Uncharacterized protein n=1 Tax=Nonomuraea solani TaxID=1144553 RepID=A0A1H6AYC7_9ACTN|nr:hypothetical protein [Nonomuraea solani]SEG53402.1 hypothetical protein SAMN05444920_10325 [Nonomuraea solani]